jgi:hypothetical protein
MISIPYKNITYPETLEQELLLYCYIRRFLKLQ